MRQSRIPSGYRLVVGLAMLIDTITFVVTLGRYETSCLLRASHSVWKRRRV